MKRFLYLLGEAAFSLRSNRTSTVIGIMTTAFTMMSFGIFLLLYLNVHHITERLQEDLQIIVYLDDPLSQNVIGDLRKALQQEPMVEAVSYISKNQALADFRQQFPGESYLLDGIGQNPLPASFIASLIASHSPPETINALAERVKTWPGVNHVRYSQAWVDRLTLFVTYLELGALLVGLILTLSSIAIIANTVRLTFYMRREEIEILRLIGATGSFIALPFVVEGAVQGIVGGGISVGLLKGIFEVIRLKLQDIHLMNGLQTAMEFFPVQWSIFLVLSGLFLGSTASLFSVYSWLKVRGA